MTFLRGFAVVMLICSPAMFSLTHQAQPALGMLAIGFGLLIPDVIDDLDLFR